MSDAEQKTEREKNAALGGQFIIPVMACGLAVYYFISTSSLVREAKATGIFIGTILMLLCGAHFVRLAMRIRNGQGSFRLGDLNKDTSFNRQRLALIILISLFILTINWIGTTPGLFLLLTSSMWLMGVRRLRVLLTVSVATAAIVHLLLIYLLGSQLPQGLLKHVLSTSGGA